MPTKVIHAKQVGFWLVSFIILSFLFFLFSPLVSAQSNPTPDPCNGECADDEKCVAEDYYGEVYYSCVSKYTDPNFTVPQYGDTYGVDRLPRLKIPVFGTKSSVGKVISAALPYFLAIASLALFLYLLFGVYQIITAMANPNKIGQGGKTITHALIGYALIVTAYLIMQVIEIVLGINILSGSPGGPTPSPSPTPQCGELGQICCAGGICNQGLECRNLTGAGQYCYSPNTFNP